jgi:hypothetical protein
MLYRRNAELSERLQQLEGENLNLSHTLAEVGVWAAHTRTRPDTQ